MGIALIDQRRFVAEEVALQVCDAERRVDLGRTSHTADEWASWGLASRDDARRFAAALDDAAEAERAALLEPRCAAAARRGARARRSRRRGASRRRAAGRACSRRRRARCARCSTHPCARSRTSATREPSPEARARLIGGLLARRGRDERRRRLPARPAAAADHDALRRIPRARRRVPARVGPESARDRRGRLEGDLRRAARCSLNAPAAAIAAAADEPLPAPLEAPPIRWRRHTVHYHGPREQIPPSMADRVIWRERRRRRDRGAARLPRTRPRGRPRSARVGGRAGRRRAPPCSAPRRGSKPRCAICCRSPRARSSAGRCPSCAGTRDALLADPAGAAWPEEPELRLCARPAVYGLDRASVGGLGGEGEVWLGWRAGDAIAAELDVASYLGALPRPARCSREAPTLSTESDAADARAPAAPRSPLWRLFAYARPYVVADRGGARCSRASAARAATGAPI